MKQIIVLVATVLLGLAIYGMIAGSGEDSIMSSTGQLWQQELELWTSQP